MLATQEVTMSLFISSAELYTFLKLLLFLKSRKILPQFNLWVLEHLWLDLPNLALKQSVGLLYGEQHITVFC